MSDLDIKSLATSISALVVFVASLYGHQLDTMTVTQLIILALSAVGTVAGIFMKHDKPTTIVINPAPQNQEYLNALRQLQNVQPQNPQPPTQP